MAARRCSPASRAAPDHDVFGGPIRARLEGGGPRACGREPAPITTLDLGPDDRDVAFVWSANMAVRRRALERIGPFDETIFVRGDEEDWQRRYAASGGRIRYLAVRRTRASPHRRRLDALRASRRRRTRTGGPPAATTCARAPRRRSPRAAHAGRVRLAHGQPPVRVRDRDGRAGRRARSARCAGAAGARRRAAADDDFALGHQRPGLGHPR